MFLAYMLHVLAAVIWVGGMFFAYQILRPVAAEALESPLRFKLWVMVFDKFFVWVRIAIVVLLLSGFAIILSRGGFVAVGWYVHAMLLLGVIMIGLFHYIKGRLLKPFRAAVADRNWSAAGESLGKIRQLVGINLVLGLITVAIASGGKYFG